MQSPTLKRLKDIFGLSSAQARLIKRLCSACASSDDLQELVDGGALPQTQAYVKQLYTSPYYSSVWRRAVILEACDEILGTCGIECVDDLGYHDSHTGEHTPRFQYCNAGDMYAQTLFYDSVHDKLFIDTLGGLCERQERLAERESSNDW